MQVSIDEVILVPQKQFNFNQVVLDKCFKTLKSITLQNNDNDTWKGSVNVKINGVDIYLNCDKCELRDAGLTSFGHLLEVAVDGNGNSTDQAPNHCLNVDSCTFTIVGKIT